MKFRTAAVTSPSMKESRVPERNITLQEANLAGVGNPDMYSKNFDMRSRAK